MDDRHDLCRLGWRGRGFRTRHGFSQGREERCQSPRDVDFDGNVFRLQHCRNFYDSNSHRRQCDRSNSGRAVGAFAGAWLGEAWKGTEPALRTEIGTAAMFGRLLGMLAKGAVGVTIFVVQLVSFWL